jgi:DNA-binding transcriptional regulator YdaS (Cro superfamily)
MKFGEWLSQEPGRLTRVAERFEISKSAVSQWVSRGVPPGRMIEIREITRGEVSLEEMLEPDCSRAA